MAVRKIANIYLGTSGLLPPYSPKVHGAVPDYVLEVLATGSAGGEAVRVGASCMHSNNNKCVRRKFSSNSGKGAVQHKVSSNSSKGVQLVRRKSSG